MSHLLNNIKSIVDVETYYLIDSLFSCSDDNKYIEYKLYGKYLDYNSLITITYNGEKCELYEYLQSKNIWYPVFYLDIYDEWYYDKDYKNIIRKYPIINDICNIFSNEILNNAK